MFAFAVLDLGFQYKLSGTKSSPDAIYSVSRKNEPLIYFALTITNTPRIEQN